MLVSYGTNSEREPTDMRHFLFKYKFSGPDAGSGNTPGPSLRVYTSGPVSFAVRRESARPEPWVVADGPWPLITCQDLKAWRSHGHGKTKR
jgi:hypothetical protein